MPALRPPAHRLSMCSLRFAWMPTILCIHLLTQHPSTIILPTPVFLSAIISGASICKSPVTPHPSQQCLDSVNTMHSMIYKIYRRGCSRYRKRNSWPQAWFSL
ncbi:hypothetical protein L208DRAFT_369145 [Tricholoma matsutake]|nr:hypothetical protein L208DRAFT_369145 [Tricholoma matsutake 945]